MSETEYNNKVAEAAEALLSHLITYDQWYLWMKQLTKEKENDEV